MSLLATLDNEIELLGGASNRDVLKGLAIALAIKSKIIHWADNTTPKGVKLLVNIPLERTDSKAINFAPLAMIEHEEERK